MAVLYRKYRSKSLDELVGQDHITTALKRSIDSGSISHAYLFTGPKGTGKTSVARILAYQLNNLPYDESATNLDIIEIDAASNRRIDEIRDLRDKVHIAPTSSKYKVYIIDEVHMLTKEAFNALLKTLEEPPAHVIFILATTELHKVPETIISRTQRFSFKPIEKQKIMNHLAYIAKEEGIKVDTEALSLIADHSEGGFRDAINLLDQVRNTESNVTADTVLDSIGAPSSSKLNELWNALQSHADNAQQCLQELLDQGYHAPLIAKSLLTEAVASHNTELARSLLRTTASHDPRTELLLLAMDLGNNSTTSVPAVAPSKVQVADDLEQATPAPQPTIQKVTPPKAVEPIKQVPVVEVTASETDAHETFDPWETVLEKIKEAKHAVYGPLRLAQASLSGTTVRLGLTFPFHVKRVNEAKSLEMIAKTIKDITSKDYSVEVYRIDQSANLETAKEPAKETPKKLPAIEQVSTDDDQSLMNDPLSIVKNVFGDAQIL